MELLFCGDVVGRSGRQAVLEHVPKLRQELHLDAVIVNGDNAAGGFGITGEICRQFFDCGVDVITGGDHVWDQKNISHYLSQEPRLLRPHNFPEASAGSGVYVFETAKGQTLLIIHLLGQVFHKENASCPFASVDEVLASHRRGGTVNAILVDMHAEATSEKMAMGQYLAGKVSAVVGSHTHVPTADARILTGGTAYQTDTGMCGDYDSVIGFDQEAPLARFKTKINKHRLEPATGTATLCALHVRIDDASGEAIECTPIQRGRQLTS